MKKKYYIFIIFFISLVVIYLNLNSSIGEKRFELLKNIFNNEQKNKIKKIFFPYKEIFDQKNQISNLKINNEYLINKISKIDLNNEKVSDLLEIQNNLIKSEIKFKDNLNNINSEKKIILSLKKNFILSKYQYLEGFYAGIHDRFPGSGYLDFYEDSLVVISSRGILGYKSLSDTSEIMTFKQIKNNINDFIGFKHFRKDKAFSIKDLLIHKNRIFISYTEEIKEDCWNTSVIFGDFNYKKIEFKKLFTPKNCVHTTNNIDGEFHAHQSGGKIISLDNNKILLSIGDYRNRFLAQDKTSINGKIIKINIDNFNYEIFSMGHRNPQGLVYDKKENFLLSTEHGPKGGDEINLINLNDNSVPNYGWPIASYGEHYSGKADLLKYKKYPLLKSHKDNNFVEPLKYFVPSIGISEIVKLSTKKYAVSSLKDNTIYIFNLNHQNQINKIYPIKINNERIRDMVYKDKKLFLFLESSASIGVIEFN